MGSRLRRALGAALAGLCLTSLASAEPSSPQSKIQNPKSKIARPFLWKIDGGDRQKPSWIFGTLHLPRPSLTQFPPVLADALRGADAVFTEIPMDPRTTLELAPLTLLPAGKTLAEVLPADLVDGLHAEIRRISPNFPLQPLDRLKPWAIAVSLVLLEDQLKNPGAVAMDGFIFQRAVMAGKEVGGLETVAEQIGIFDVLTPSEQTTLVRDTVDQIRTAREEGESSADQLTRVYLAGDLPALTAEVERWNGLSSDPALTARFMEQLLHARNERMAGRIIEKLRAHPAKSQFFAVGAAHLDGPRGLLALLERAGYRLDRAKSAEN